MARNRNRKPEAPMPAVWQELEAEEQASPEEYAKSFQTLMGDLAAPAWGSDAGPVGVRTGAVPVEIEPDSSPRDYWVQHKAEDSLNALLSDKHDRPGLYEDMANRARTGGLISGIGAVLGNAMRTSGPSNLDPIPYDYSTGFKDANQLRLRGEQVRQEAEQRRLAAARQATLDRSRIDLQTAQRDYYNNRAPLVQEQANLAGAKADDVREQTRGRQIINTNNEREMDPTSDVSRGLRETVLAMPEPVLTRLGITRENAETMSYRELRETLFKASTDASLRRQLFRELGRGRGGSGAGSATNLLAQLAIANGTPEELAQAYGAMFGHNRQAVTNAMGALWTTNRQRAGDLQRRMREHMEVSLDLEPRLQAARNLQRIFDRHSRADILQTLQAMLVSRNLDALPAGVLPTEAQDLARSVETLAASIRHELYGATLTDKEVASFNTQMAASLTQSPEVTMAAIRDMMLLVDKARRGIAAAYGDVEQAIRNGGAMNQATQEARQRVQAANDRNQPAPVVSAEPGANMSVDPGDEDPGFAGFQTFVRQ